MRKIEIQIPATVLFLRISIGTSGRVANLASHTRKTTNTTPLRISGTKTAAEFHGNVTPPHVRPSKRRIEKAIAKSDPT